MKAQRLAAGVLALASAAPLSAACGEGMTTVEVVGIAPQGGLGVERKQLPYAVQSISLPQQGETVGETMARSLAGVNVNEVSGSPYQNDLTFRGFRASPVLGTSQGLSVYLDGVRVNEPFGDVVNWDMLPEAAIGKLLLAPGSNPLYGLNTLGGALVLSTRSGLTDPGFSAGASTSSQGRRRLDAARGARSDDGWHSYLAATVFHDRGWRNASTGRLGNLFAKVGRSTGASDWQVSLLGASSRLIGNGLLPDDLYAVDRRSVYTSPDRTRNQLRQMQASLHHQLNAATEVSLAVYARTSRRDTTNGDISDTYADWLQAANADAEAPPPAALNTAATRQRGQGASAGLQTVAGAHRLAFGASFDRSSMSFAQYSQRADFGGARDVRPLGDNDERELEAAVTGRSRGAGLFASDTWTIAPAWYVTMAARYSHARVSNALLRDDGSLQREAFTYRKLNPSLGIAHELQPGFTLFANAAQSNRVPTVIELGCADPAEPCRLPVGLQSDPYLKQVVSRTIEAGARWKSGDSSATLALYRTINRDDILFRAAGQTQHGYFGNFPRTRHQGLDFSAATRAGAFDLRFAYSYLDAAYGAAGRLFTGTRDVSISPGNRIAGLPRHTLKLAADWSAAPGLTLGANVTAVSHQTVQGNEDGAHPGWRIAGHGLLSLHATYKTGKWEWYARVSNLTSRRYETYGAAAASFFPGGRLLTQGQDEETRFVAPGAPRAVAAGVRFSF
jgi:outer membrane receptor protein involved in Fe transport